MSRNSAYGAAVAIVALICIFIIQPLVNAGSAWALIPLVAILALAALFWRPLQAWAAHLASRQPLADATALERRIAQLEALTGALGKQQSVLQETVRWQEQLLRHPAPEPAAIPRRPVPTP